MENPLLTAPTTQKGLQTCAHRMRTLRRKIPAKLRNPRVRNAEPPGHVQGIEKGKQEGRQDALILQLEKRFGQVDEAVKERIRRIHSAERLDALLLAVLDAKSLEDLPL